MTWAVTLDADDISDSTTTNKFVTATDKTNWDWLNTKTFTLSSTSDLVNAQAAYDWIKSGKNAILRLATNNREYPFLMDDTSSLIFMRANNIDVTDTTGSASIIDAWTITLYYSGDTVTSIVKGHESTYKSVLLTDLDYATPYTPQYDWSPATKKYVDDHWVPNWWNNWDVLTNVSWTPTWQAPSGWDVMVSSQSWNILTSWMKIWAWTEADYWNLGTYDDNTVYLTI
jgi:hypothetical protein